MPDSCPVPSYPTSLPMASQSWWKLVQFSKCKKPCCSSASQASERAIAWNETRWGISNENNPTGFPDIDIILYDIISYYIISYYIILYYIILHYIIYILYYIKSYHIILYYIMLYYIILHYIIYIYIIWYQIISYYIILYHVIYSMYSQSQYSKNEDGVLNSKFHPPSASGLYRSVLSTLRRSWADEGSTECSDGPGEPGEPMMDSLNSGEARHRIHMVNIGEP